MITLTKISAFTIETPKALPHPRLRVIVREDGRVLTPRKGWSEGFTTPDGYKKVWTRGQVYSVHRLVAETFIPNPEGKPTVDHIDRCKSRNSVDNLRWANYTEQADNTKKVLRCVSKFGIRPKEDYSEYKRRRYKKDFIAIQQDPEKYRQFREQANIRNRRYKAKKKARSEE